jgi:hypothetical protein
MHGALEREREREREREGEKEKEKERPSANLSGGEVAQM